MRIELTVNGERREADVWAGESLLFALRDRLGLPGSKNACEQGECGSCSVLLEGVLVCSCLVLAAQADGHEVVTVEGLAGADGLHPVQEAFAETGAVQCGFCTPGFVVAAADLLRRTPDPSDDEIREALSGNLCRCTGYQKILDAVPGQKTYGLEFADQPVLASDRVRYYGEPVAIVAAEEPEQARRAAAAIRVDYEPLEAIVDPERATEMEELHPDRPTMGHGYR